MKRFIKKAVKRIPQIKRVIDERDQLRCQLAEFTRFFPPGHFYSPIPSLEEVEKNEARLFGSVPKQIPGIELNESRQLDLFAQFKEYYGELPFQPTKTENLRYFYDNPAYSYSDGIFLYCMIRHFRPKRIIEVGSGYSSCVILDTNEMFFNNSIETTFVDPYAELLFLTLVKGKDKERIDVLPKGLQEVDQKVFESLGANDILFVDSTHVCKIDSDVNHLFFEIFPCLNDGVLIHLHDVFYPFEYPKEWFYEGRAWNESYILRAFLQYNLSFEIMFFNTYFQHFHKDLVAKEMPLCLKNEGGSIWLRKCKEIS